MLSDATREVIQRWVDDRFGVNFSELLADDFYYIEHGGRLVDYAGIYVWQMDDKTLISLPADMQAIMYPVAWQLVEQHLPFTALIDPQLWRAALGDQVERIVGPSYQGFVDADHFQPADENGARALTAADQPLLQRFMASCPPDAWQDSAIAPDHEPLIGLERDGELIALASAPLDGSADVGVRSVGVVTLPAWRGRGAGLAVVSALTARCLEQDMARGATLHYQTLRANLPAVAIARRLGYEDMATALAIRLR